MVNTYVARDTKLSLKKSLLLIIFQLPNQYECERKDNTRHSSSRINSPVLDSINFKNRAFVLGGSNFIPLTVNVVSLCVCMCV